MPSVGVGFQGEFVSVNVTTETNRSYRVQSSGDLQSWETLTNFVSANGNFSMSVGAGERRFFRAVTP